MRILFIGTTFPDETSPARGTYNSALCAALAAEHEVHVVSPRAFTAAIPYRIKGQKYQLPEHLKNAGIHAYYPTFWYTPRYRQEFSGDQMWWSVKKVIRQQIAAFQPEAILSYWAHPEGEVGVRTAQLANVPSAVIVGGSDVLLLPKIPRRGKRVQDVLLQSDTVITVSDGLRDSVIEMGTSPGRVQTIYQGVDSAVFHRAETRTEAQQKLKLNTDQKHLVWVGRMVPVKALDVLVDAAALLQQSNPNFVLHLIGDGPERSRIEQRVQSEQLSGNVSFEGAIGHDQIADWYRAGDATVMSSDSEGLPNVLRESLACGTPFVTTDVGSIQEITDEIYSVVVPKRNPAALADGIKVVLAGNHAENARQFTPRTWDMTARETVELFEKLIQERSAMSRNDKNRVIDREASTVLHSN